MGEEKPFCLVVQVMPRGGTLVEGEGFRLQVGAYPETIKDTLNTELGVPDLYLLPEDLFDFPLGISASDLEFPVYYNFYIKGRKCRFICQKHQLRPILKVLREAVFGPRIIKTEQEYPQGKETPGYPDLHKEMAYYKLNPKLPGGRLRLKHVIEPHIFDDSKQIVVDGVKISIIGHDRYRFEKNGSSCECQFEPARESAMPISPTEPPPPQEHFYTPPTFGVTVIGSGHGFDADANTSGFIIWIDGKGVLVDPPVNSTAWLKRNKINTRLIEDLILTHCHADHDSGTLQKILEEGRVCVHTTETIMNSFITKYCLLTGLSTDEFRTLYEFQPVSIGRPVPVAGGEFRFKYTLHPIPTINFEVQFEDHSFFYSSDTLYDPGIIKSCHEQGVLSKSRMDDLLDFPMNETLIFHEAGIPPIHTPIKVLASLPEDVRKSLYVVHVSEKSIPPDSGLKIARPGAVNTVSIETEAPKTSLAHKMLDIMAHIDLFSDMKITKAVEFMAITHHQVFEPGETVIKRETYGDKFFMVLSGEVEVIREKLPHRLFYSRYDYFGERAIILDVPRSADIIAVTRTELLYMLRDDFLHFIRETNLFQIFTRLNMNRLFGARWIFEKHRILAGLSALQKNQLMCMMISEEVPSGTYLFRIGDRITSYFLLDKGTVKIIRDGKEKVLGPGSPLGEFDRTLRATHYSLDARAESDLVIYRIRENDMKAFFKINPGTYVRLVKSMEG